MHCLVRREQFSETTLEQVIVIPPNQRLCSSQIALLLRKNGLKFRIVGKGAGLLRTDKEPLHTVKDLLVLEVKKDRAVLLKYLQLFGLAYALVTAS